MPFQIAEDCLSTSLVYVQRSERQRALKRLAQSKQNVHVKHDGPAGGNGGICFRIWAAAVRGLGSGSHDKSTPAIAIEMLHALQGVCYNSTPTNQQCRHDRSRGQHIDINAHEKTVKCTQLLLPPMSRSGGANLNYLLHS